MTVRLPAGVAALSLLIATACLRPEIPPAQADQPDARASPALPVAPPPRAKGDHLPPPVPEAVGSAQPGKIDVQLLVGKWIEVRHGLGAKHQATIEFTGDGRIIIRVCTNEPRDRVPPQRLIVETMEHRPQADLLFPFRSEDDGGRVQESTTIIKSLTENELVTVTFIRSRWSLALAKEEAAQRKVPLEVILAEFREETESSFYVRAKDYCAIRTNSFTRRGFREILRNEA